MDRAPSAGAVLAVWPGRGWRKTDGQPSSGGAQVVGLLRKQGPHGANNSQQTCRLLRGWVQGTATLLKKLFPSVVRYTNLTICTIFKCMWAFDLLRVVWNFSAQAELPWTKWNPVTTASPPVTL